MSYYCEDFPCCGHESGDCPNPNPRKGHSGYKCVGCGKPLLKDWPSSFCHRKVCERTENRRRDREYDVEGY